MIRIITNGGPPQGFDDDRLRSCLRVDSVSQASGRVRDAAAIARAHLWRSLTEDRFLTWSIWLAVVMPLAFIADYPRNSPGTALLVGAIVLYQVLWAAHRVMRSREWRSTIPALLAALPPVGTLIEAGADGLTIGTTRTPWDTLRVEELSLRELIVSTNFYRTRFRVDHMTLTTAAGPVTLDPVAIEHGQKIVDAIFQRAVQPRVPKPPWAVDR